MNDSNIIQIERPAPPAVVEELAPVVAEAQAFVVNSQETHAESLEREKTLRAGEKKIHEWFEPSRKKTDEAKREILKLRDGLIAPIKQARMVYGNTNTAYETAERRKAQEEQRKLQEQARKEEEERQIQAAIDAEAAGDKAEAEKIMAEPVSTPVVTVAPAVAKVKGLSPRTVWSAEVTDLHALVRFVAANHQWVNLVEASMPNLNRLAVSQHKALSIPGVRPVSKTAR